MKCFILEILLLSMVCCEVQDKPISNGKLKLHKSEEIGVAKVRKGVKMFWWLRKVNFADSEHGYKKYPLVVWPQGSPGMSASSYGNFLEVGPYDMEGNMNNASWVQKVNVLFIDSPVGYGFSVAKYITALPRTNQEVGKDLVALLKHFLKYIPEFQTVPLYIVGESYSSRSVVSFTEQLIQAVRKGEIRCSLKAIALGSPWISPLDSVRSWPPYLYAFSLVDAEGASKVVANAEKVQLAVEVENHEAASTFILDTHRLIAELTNYINVRNIAETDPTELRKREKRIRKFMNDVVKPEVPVISKKLVWGAQENYMKKRLEEDTGMPITNGVEKILNSSDVTVFIYSCQMDMVANSMGTSEWIRQLRWPGAKAFAKTKRNPWLMHRKSDDREHLIGFYKKHPQLRFYTFRSTGHLVAMDDPKVSLEFLKELLRK